MKVFVGNYDGRRQAMVAARSRKAAAEALGISVYALNGYYSPVPVDHEKHQLALAAPGVVFLRPYLANEASGWKTSEWTPKDGGSELRQGERG